MAPGTDIDAAALPGWVRLDRQGELEDRIRRLMELASPCRLCPRDCRVPRLEGALGHCRTGPGAPVASATAHFGEEPEISGTRGSGTVFFAGCSLRCLYCQNHQISQDKEESRAEAPSPEALARIYRSLQDRGVHNLNWVTPSHVVPWALQGLREAASLGVDLPLVYNTSGYDALATLKALEGVVDIYLADLRYGDDEAAMRCSGAPDYVPAARAAIREMARQVGTENSLGPDGLLRRGLVIRLLVLPNDLASIRETLAFLKAELGTGVRIALMSQYYPAHRAPEEPLLSRPVSAGEYWRAVDWADRMGFDNLLIQEFEARHFYRPDFQRQQEPFEDARHFAGPPSREDAGP